MKEKRQNQDAFVNNLMIDLLRAEGYTITERRTRRVLKAYSIKMFRIKTISFENKVIDNEKMIEIGKECHGNLMRRISTRKGVEIYPYDYSLDSSLSSDTFSL